MEERQVQGTHRDSEQPDEWVHVVNITSISERDSMAEIFLKMLRLKYSPESQTAFDNVDFYSCGY